MIIKVCGIKSTENIAFLKKAKIDMVGLNFYPLSVRYIEEDMESSRFALLPSSLKRVGVFVNEDMTKVLELVKKFRLDMVQLHGNEDAAYCLEVSKHVALIKVFRVSESFDFSDVVQFGMSSYFLFDTYCEQYGGSGKKFNWEVLDNYKGDIPFLLSGGIGPDDYVDLLNFTHPHFAGIDINSKFEITPGIKEAQLVLPFVAKIKAKSD